MNKVYLLVRIVDDKIVETNDKVYTNEEFAKKVCKDCNDCYCGNGTWQIKELDVDTYQ